MSASRATAEGVEPFIATYAHMGALSPRPCLEYYGLEVYALKSQLVTRSSRLSHVLLTCLCMISPYNPTL